MTANGSVKVLYSFSGTDNPAVGFVQGTDRKFYGRLGGVAPGNMGRSSTLRREAS